MPQSLAQFGQTIKAKHPEYSDMSDEDVATKVLAKYPQYRDMVTPTVAGAGPLGLPQPKNPTVQMEAPALGSAPQIAADTLEGAGKGALNTVNGVSSLINKIPVVGETLAPSSGIRAARIIAQPNNTAQRVGKIGEQAAEFLVPGPAEEAALAHAAPYVGKAAPLLKAGLAALGSGVVNKAQGGSFTAGAVAGGVGSGIGQGLQSLAPTIAESSLGIRKLDRAYKMRTPGMAALEDTSGITPSAVEQSGQATLNKLTPQLKTLMRTNALAPVDLGKPLSVVTDAQNAALAKNAQGSFNQLNPMANHLTANFATGQRFGQMVPAEDALNLKRGFGDEFVHNWNPETMKGTRSVAAKAYGTLADEIHSSVPGSADLDNRISSLIPVVNRAESVSRGASSTQQMFHKLAVPTGAMAAPLGMAAYGYEKGGTGEAARKFAEGMAIPLLVSSPTGQMALARTLNSNGLRRMVIPALTGAALQYDRSKDSPDQ